MRRGVDARVACFPLIVNTVAGLKSADEDRINLMRSFAASRSQVFWMLRLPTDGLGISGRSGQDCRQDSL
jgi:ABC-type molybdate transport system permease subunit